MRTVHKWGLFELELSGDQVENPYLNVEVECVFSLGSREVKVDGFYNGDDNYVIRFSPDKEGDWSYKVRSSSKMLDGQKGTFNCVTNESAVKGPVKVSDTFHFQFEDGTPYYPFGTTAYGWNHQKEDVQKKTLATLKDAPFNKIRMCVFPKHYSYNAQEPDIFPFEGTSNQGFNYDHINPEFFKKLDSQIKELDSYGIQLDLILFHPYDRWGFSKMTPEQDDRYLQYIVARLSSFNNIWWSLANEYDLLRDKSVEDWDRFFKIIQEKDHVQHLRSIHNWQSPRANTNHWYDHNKPWVTHVSIQHSQMYPIDGWRKVYRKPIVNDECRYEGNLSRGWGNITAEKMTLLHWQGIVCGGYVTHGETFLSDDEIIWWAHGGVLHGESSKRIEYLKEMIEEDPIKRLSLFHDSWDTQAGINDKEDFLLFYFGEGRPAFQEVELPSGTFTCELIDTWNMTSQLLGEYKGKVKIELPSKQYMALKFKKKEI